MEFLRSSDANGKTAAQTAELVDTSRNEVEKVRAILVNLEFPGFPTFNSHAMQLYPPDGRPTRHARPSRVYARPRSSTATTGR